MTITRAIEFETATLVGLGALVGITFAFFMHGGVKTPTSLSLPVVALAQPTPTAIPTPTVTTFSQSSPDGKKEILMTVTPNQTTSKTYTFQIADGDGSNSHPLYSINLPNAESMDIPYNAFSPDDKYLFLEHNSANGTEAFVFHANGDPMTQDATYYNTKEIFDARQTGNTYQTTTGWASETLLIINTSTSTGDKGPSYWLEIPSKAVIQLATEF